LSVVSYCDRGCRLLRVIELTSGSQLNSSELLDLCSHACDGAYDTSTNVAAEACRFGCSSQMSGVIQRRTQLMMLHEMQQLIVMDFLSRIYWQLYSAQDNSNNNNGVVVSARVMIVSVNNNDYDNNNNNDMMSVQSLEQQQQQQQQRVEYSVSEHRDQAVNLPGTRYSALNDSSVVAMLLISLLLITGFSCLFHCDTQQQQQQHEKLSIYGDSADLQSIYGVDDPLIDVPMRVNSKKLLFAAPRSSALN